MSVVTVVEENAEKLTRLEKSVGRVIHILEGEGESAPGLMARLLIVERALWGKNNQDGIVQKVGILWRMHVWVLCTLSGLAGFALREIVRLIWKI